MYYYKITIFLLIFSFVLIGSSDDHCLTIFHVNDILSRFDETCEQSPTGSQCWGGFIRLYDFLKKQNREGFRETSADSKNTLFLIAGDTSSTHVWYQLMKENVVAHFLNTIEVDVMALGDKDFVDGVKGLEKLLELMSNKIKIVAANIDINMESKLEKLNRIQKSVIIDINDQLKIGIVGYITPDVANLENTGSIEFIDEIRAVAEESDRLRLQENCNFIIALGHSGYENDLDLARNSDVDVIIGGHSQTFLDNPDEHNRQYPDQEVGPYPRRVYKGNPDDISFTDKVTYIGHAYAYAKYVGSMKFCYDDNDKKFNLMKAKMHFLDQNVTEENQIHPVLDKYKTEFHDKYETKVVYSSTRINNKITICKHRECPMGSLLTDSMTTFYENRTLKLGEHFDNITIDGAIVTANIFKNKLIFDFFTIIKLMNIFTNTSDVHLLIISGDMLWRIFRTNADHFRTGDFFQVSKHFEVTYKQTSYSNIELKSLKLNNEPINLKRDYYILVNRYLRRNLIDYSRMKFVVEIEIPEVSEFYTLLKFLETNKSFSYYTEVANCNYNLKITRNACASLVSISGASISLCNARATTLIMSKRKPDFQVPPEESDLLLIRPLGAGQEVGRSCIILEFKGKKIMLDCGIHPGLSGMDALPFVDLIEADEIDLLLISHFHLDHCGALPWFLQKTTFKGRCFMTHATKAIYRWLLSDYIKVSVVSSEQMLYSEHDLEASMNKIETINFHEEKDVMGIKFWAYNAGHVLGAAMFMIEIAGVKILYTGDFSRQEDRHLMSAEIPTVHPDILITESTYGTHVHENREDRESRFTNLVHDIVNRGGRCLIPVFALGRAQELLLILDEYWSQHPELHDIPIYYASSLAKKCMSVYQTYINAMNEKIRKQIAINNPFVFKHISNLKSIDQFEDIGACVVMASPGMMQSGLSRELFEAWCTDSKNGVIIAGYCVEGTLAKTVLSEPQEIVTMSGQKLPLNMSVNYISFSAHTDYEQTSEFIKILQPSHIVLVHGEQNEMGRLKTALQRQFAKDPDRNIVVYNPKNTQSVDLYFRGEKSAKVIGNLAIQEPVVGHKVSGVLVKRSFNYSLLAPEDLGKYSNMTVSQITQRQSVHYSGSLDILKNFIKQMADSFEILEPNKFRVFQCIQVLVVNKTVILEWDASPINDMYADTVLTAVLQAEFINGPTKSSNSVNQFGKAHFKECLIEMLQEMFGEDSVPKNIESDTLFVKVDDKKAVVDISNLSISCPEDEIFEKIVRTAVTKLHDTLIPTEE